MTRRKTTTPGIWTEIAFWEKEEGNPTREEIHEMDHFLGKRKVGFTLKGNLEMKK